MLCRLLLLCIFAGSIIIWPARGQEAPDRGTVEGVVTDERGEPLVGVNVAAPAIERGTTTATDGTYVLDDLPAGLHALQFSFVGYQTVVREVTVEAGDTVTRDVSLPQRVIETDEVVVTGTPVATDPLRSAQDVDVLDPEQLQAQRSAALGDVLAESVSGISSIKTGAQAGKPVLRGLSGNRIRLLKDGVAQEYYQYGVRHFPNTSLTEAERLEVVRGASSIQYGSDALGGAINVISKPTPTMPGAGILFGGTAEGQYFSNNNERAGRLDVRGANGGVGFRAGVERRIADNFTTPDHPTFFETGRGGTYGDPKYTGEVPFTNFAQVSGYGQFGVQGRFGSAQLYVDHWANRQNFVLPAGGPIGSPDNPPVGLGQNLEHTNVAAKARLLIGRFVVRPRLSVQRAVRQSGAPGTSLEDMRAAGGIGGFDYPLDLKTDVYTARVEAAHPTFGRVDGTWGVDVQAQDADTRGSAELQPSARLLNAGAFAFEEVDLDPLTLSAGARIDHRAIETAPNERTTDPVLLDVRYTTLSGALGANYLVADGVALAANLSSGFRAPSIFELYANGVHGGVAALQRGNPHLAPERSFSGDFSVRVRRERVTGEVTGYVNYIADYIFLANTGEMDAESGLPVYAAQQTNAVVRGVDATVAVNLRSWLRVGGQAALLASSGEGLADGGDGALPLIPADNVQAFVQLAHAELGPLRQASARISTRHAFAKDAAGRYEPFAQFDGGFGPPFGTASTRAYTVFDLRLGATLPVAGVPLALTAGVNNIFDETYRDFLDTYKGYALSPGRDVTLKVAVPFASE